MVRRSAARRVEEFILFDVLYEDGTRTSNRKVPGSELSDPDPRRAHNGTPFAPSRPAKPQVRTARKPRCL